MINKILFIWKLLIFLFLGSWLKNWGGNTLNFQKLGLHILSQPSSAFVYEHSWCLFDAIHLKKHNKLTQQCLNDLVFV